MKKISIIMILGLILAVIGISGCTSSTSNQNYTGSKMSFTYPSSYSVNQNTSSDSIVALEKGNQEITVNIIDDTLNNENFNILADGWTYKGLYNTSGVNYKVFTMSGNDIPTVYLFKKNGKVFELTGHTMDVDAMDQITQTIK